MLYTRETVRDNIRNRDGKRVFYLGGHDQLTPGARDFLREQRIEILSAELAKPEEYLLLGGGVIREKPEHMTHLRGNILVDKTLPIIAFRGAIDILEAEIILCQLSVTQKLTKELGEILALTRELIACDVLEKPLVWDTLCGMTQEELHRRSHLPQEYYGQPHFMPQASDGRVIALLNRCRCIARQAELAAAHAFQSPEGCSRPDLLTALNRISSTLYLLMIQQKAGQKDGHSSIS